MKQIIITEANNGFVVEVKERGELNVMVASNTAKVLKIVKEQLKQEAPEDPPF